VAIGTPSTQSVIRSGGATGGELNKKQIEVVQRVNLYFNQLGSLKRNVLQNEC